GGWGGGGWVAGGWVRQREGLQRTSASRSGFLTGLLVIFVPLLELLLFRKRPPLFAGLGVLLSLCGMALLSNPFGAQSSATLLGDMLTVACAVIFAGHILLLGKVTRQHPLLSLLLLQLASVAVAALLLGPIVEAQRLAPTPRVWTAIAYLAIFCTLLAFAVQTWAQRHTSPLRMALISVFEPVFAALWA